MKIKPIIIGIAGTKQSGKDTVASMINYMLSEGLVKADYYTWLKKHNVFKNDRRIIHFADKLKDYCSEIFDIDRSYFDITTFKDDRVYSIANKSFILRYELNTDIHHEITIQDLKEHDLDLMTTHTYINIIKRKFCVISLRTIMQYIGTEIFRNKINKDFWANITINNAKLIADSGYCIISDVRFENEAQSIINTSYRGIVIKIDRNVNNDLHESEIIDFNTTYTIENKSSKMALFYKLLTLMKDIISK